MIIDTTQNSIQNENKWERNCPKCEIKMMYSSNDHLIRAKKNNSPCRQCTNTNKEYKEKQSKLHTGRPNLKNRKMPFEYLYNVLVYKANKKNILCTLSFDDFLYFTTIKNCSYCKDLILWKPHRLSGTNFGYNLDRKNNNEGYSKDNCCVCCKDCNMFKNSIFSYNEMMELGQVITLLKEKRK